MKLRNLSLGLAAGLLGLAFTLPLAAQMTVVVGDGGEVKVEGGATQPGGSRVIRIDQAQMREQMNKQLKADLAATDDEWKVLQAKIEKVQNLQSAAAMARYGARFGAPANASDPAADLRAAAAKSETTDAELKAKIAAFREAQAKAKAELTKAQDDLRSVITVRQEATLIARGILD